MASHDTRTHLQERRSPPVLKGWQCQAEEGVHQSRAGEQQSPVEVHVGQGDHFNLQRQEEEVELLFCCIVPQEVHDQGQGEEFCGNQT